MYERRRLRAAAQTLQNENTHQAQAKTHLMNKGVPHAQKSDNMKGQVLAVNNRRALGEIGNLVGALSARCTVSKDGLPQQQENLTKSTAVDLNAKAERPITRKFGANLASNVQLPHSHLVPGLHPLEDTGIGSHLPHNDAPLSWRSKQRRTMGQPAARSRLSFTGSNQPAVEHISAELPPTYAQHRMLYRAPANNGNLMPAVKKRQTLTAILTARSEAACGGFEVEMEEAEEPLPNIDIHDVGNQLAVLDYVEDIYSFYRKAEIQSCVSPEYMARQSDINEKMRAILNDWLIEVHLKFKLMPETLYLTINLIDRFLACNLVMRKNLQLVGVTAMLLACKYEEIWAPEIKDFVKICDKAYTREQLLEMEKLMLNKLKFNLTVPTPYVFLVRFLKAASSDTQLEMLAFFLTELCLPEYSMIKYCPSLLAAAAVYTAQLTIGRSPRWSTILQRHSGYTEMHLRDCSVQMVGFHKSAGVIPLTAVYKKYANAKFCSVAVLEPAALS
ncbi:hypothetical protein GOP47_0013318 [Adiantum capillus-veneris]|uniref:B-like cyclin n=1 Tax=Adiantum capillus-veneris TaxID=13818 RepID=A0A9D4UP85_ADICA|nr:hypothetical protein GOP47_0013318 [Adiantum capillus-veneris]